MHSVMDRGVPRGARAGRVQARSECSQVVARASALRSTEAGATRHFGGRPDTGARVRSEDVAAADERLTSAKGCAIVEDDFYRMTMLRACAR